MTVEEKAKIGYQAAISLITYEGQNIWRSFSSLFIINTGLITFSGVISKLKLFHEYAYASPLISFLGIIICFAWFFVLRRNFSLFGFWFAWARHFEEKYLSPEIQITIMGKLYGEGEQFYKNDNLPKIEPIGWTSKAFKVQWLMILIIIIFGLLHFIMFLSCLY